MSDPQHSLNPPLSNTVERADHQSWPGSAALGIVFFVALYWIVPSWANSYLASLEQSIFYPVLEQLFRELMPWVKASGTVLGSLCVCRALLMHRRERKEMLDQYGAESNETA